MSWQRRKIVVTGAGGFIGSHLCERLVRQGAEVTAFVHYRALGSEGWLRHSAMRRDLRLIAGDVTDRDSIRSALRGAQCVIHLAALISIPHSRHSPGAFVRTQIEGTANVVQEAIDQSLESALVASTSEVYGTATTPLIDEDHALRPRSPYAASKVGAEKLAETVALDSALRLTIVRPFNTYGPRQSARAIIPSLICQAIRNGEAAVGNLYPTRDFTFVDDTVEGLLAIAQAAPPSTILNLGNSREIAIGELVARIGRLLGREPRLIIDPRRQRTAAGEVDRLCADTTRLVALTGWQPKVSLDEGLRRTIEWIRSHPEHYDTEHYAY